MPGASRETIDGVDVITVSQSWLSTFISCPEQARRLLTGELGEHSTPESELGTVNHAGIEMLVKGATMQEAETFVLDTLNRYSLPPGHKWDTSKSKTGNHWSIADLAVDCLWQWHDRFWVAGPKLSQIPNLRSEHHFVTTLFEDELGRVELRGCVDLHAGLALFDNKFSARKWNQWEVDRYDIQSVAYSIGLLGTKLPAPITFKFVVVNPDKFAESQVVAVQRNQSHVDAFLDMVRGVVQIIRADLPKWPATGHDWKCSPKWCGAWDACKGSHGLSW